MDNTLKELKETLEKFQNDWNEKPVMERINIHLNDCKSELINATSLYFLFCEGEEDEEFFIQDSEQWLHEKCLNLKEGQDYVTFMGTTYFTKQVAIGVIFDFDARIKYDFIKEHQENLFIMMDDAFSTNPF